MKKNTTKRNKRTPLAPPTANVVADNMAPVPEVIHREVPLPVAPAEKVTEVKAKVDVGWGNALFIRGEGDGLSWDKGTPLVCADSSTWIWATRRVSTNVVFKLLLNDNIWATGTDAVVQPGNRLELVPIFHRPTG